MSQDAFLNLDRVEKHFQLGERGVTVLKGISFELALGEALAVTGPSGSGKSTLLHLIGTLDQPSAGRVNIDGQDPFVLDERRLAEFRNQRMGFVFQDHHLLPQYSVLENVLLPVFAFKNKAGDEQGRARELLDRVGLADRLEHRPGELSGGERQRVAIARALINRPRLLLCDEPTGNLDQETSQSVSDLLFELHRAENNAMILVTHSPQLAQRCPRRYEFRAGVLHDFAATASESPG